MKSILGAITDPKNRNIILAILAVIFMSLWFSECRSHRADLAKAKLQSELTAQNDSAREGKLVIAINKKDGEIESTKQSFVTTIEGLKKTSDSVGSLYAESKKEIGTLRAIITTQGSVSTSPVTISDSLKRIDSVTYSLAFSKSHLDSTLQWSISGRSTFKLINNTILPGSTEILTNRLTVPIVLGFVEENNDYKVFARSSSPDVTFNLLNGALIIPKPGDIAAPACPEQKKWGIGPFVGLGFGGSSLTPTICVGVGINYSIISF